MLTCSTKLKCFKCLYSVSIALTVYRLGMAPLLAITRTAMYHCASQSACQRRVSLAFMVAAMGQLNLCAMSETIEREKMRQRSERVNGDRPSYIILKGIA